MITADAPALSSRSCTIRAQSPASAACTSLSANVAVAIPQTTRVIYRGMKGSPEEGRACAVSRCDSTRFMPAVRLHTFSPSPACRHASRAHSCLPKAPLHSYRYSACRKASRSASDAVSHAASLAASQSASHSDAYTVSCPATLPVSYLAPPKPYLLCLSPANVIAICPLRPA